MNSQAKTIEAYLQDIPSDRREVLAQLDQLCRQVLHGYQPSMDYGMPCYRKPGGEIEVAFASQKNYISIYILKNEILDQYRDELSHLSLGKGCIRYRKPEQMDFSLVEKILIDTLQSTAGAC
ncbi:DUF1801 domain-containing protein [Chloroflexota bacterium]|nr:DUF1801 domain-containing protein [Chloroflexota bacterium]